MERNLFAFDIETDRFDLPHFLVPLLMREFRVGSRSVFWWMERSGFLQTTGGRERSRGLEWVWHQIMLLVG